MACRISSYVEYAELRLSLMKMYHFRFITFTYILTKSFGDFLPYPSLFFRFLLRLSLLFLSLIEVPKRRFIRIDINP